jgi:nitroreductase
MAEQAELFSRIVRSRRSVRGFLPELVPEQILKELFSLAQWAPSNCNTQPWQVYVASGKKLQALKQALCEVMSRSEMDLDFPFDLRQYQGIYKERQVTAAEALFSAMELARDDKAGRQASFLRNYQFFDAPHAAFIFMSAQFAEREAADIGMYAQTLMLAFTANGIACCPQTSLSFNAGVVRKLLDVPEDNKLLFGVSFGYEDKTVKANQCRTQRAALEENVHFVTD